VVALHVVGLEHADAEGAPLDQRPCASGR
jgi:hypothetical protein